jgi:predicted nucleotidyltransferase
MIQNMGRQQVIEALRAQRPLLHERFGVARLALFGSVARDKKAFSAAT